MAEGEPNLSVQLFVELKERFPQASELRLQNMIKQFANNREKCLEALNKEYSSMSSPSHPNNNHHQVSNSWINYNVDNSASYSSNAHKPWSPIKSMNISEMKPNSNPDFGPFIKTSSDSSTIPNIKCQSSPSPPVMQIAVHHITTSKPDSPNPHMFCKSPSSSSSSSPNNGNQWNWPINQQKSHEVMITPTSSASTQHFAKANLFIDTPNRNVANHPSSGGTCVISPNPRLQPLTRPAQLITIHSPQPGSQSGGLYSPQPGYSGHGAPDHFTHLSNSPNPVSWKPDVNPVLSSSQLCIPVQVQPTTSSPSTLHRSSATYQTMSMPQQNMGNSTTSTIIHYPAIHVNNSLGQPGNCTSSESNRTSNHMPIMQTVGGSPSDSVQIPRPRNGSLQEDPDYTNALIRHQRLRYDKLNEDYKLMYAQYQELDKEITKLDRQKSYSKPSFPNESDVFKLRSSTESLRLEIKCMTGELDAQNNGQTPIGVIDPLEQQHFYRNMNTGPSGSIFATPQSPSRNVPPRPARYQENHPVPPPLPDHDLVEESWSCSKCTYSNHQALDKCEMCEFPRKHKGRVNPHHLQSHCNSDLCYCHDH